MDDFGAADRGSTLCYDTIGDLVASANNKCNYREVTRFVESNHDAIFGVLGEDARLRFAAIRDQHYLNLEEIPGDSSDDLNLHMLRNFYAIHSPQRALTSRAYIRSLRAHYGPHFSWNAVWKKVERDFRLTYSLPKGPILTVLYGGKKTLDKKQQEKENSNPQLNLNSTQTDNEANDEAKKSIDKSGEQKPRPYAPRPTEVTEIGLEYARIIDSYRLRLEVQFDENNDCPEQSFYNYGGDLSQSPSKQIDEQFRRYGHDDDEIYGCCKDLRGYVKRGIERRAFADWITIEDLIPIIYMGRSHETHTIRKRVHTDKTNGDSPICKYYCLDGDGERVEVSLDLLLLADKVTSKTDDDSCSYDWSYWSDIDGLEPYVKHWYAERQINELCESKIGGDWYLLYECTRTAGKAWRYLCHPEVQKLHLKLTYSRDLRGLAHAFPNLTSLVIDHAEHMLGTLRYEGNYRGCFADEFRRVHSNVYHADLDFSELKKLASMEHLEIWLDGTAPFKTKEDLLLGIDTTLCLEKYRVKWEVPTSADDYQDDEEKGLYPLFRYYPKHEPITFDERGCV